MSEISELKSRIEALIAERDDAERREMAAGDKAVEYLDRAEAAEAKLAKAVEGLEDIVKDCEADYPPSHGAIKYFARATLAEIKGESHE